MNKPCILTVEDDSAIRRGIVDTLEFAGYLVLEADRGDTGLELALTRSCQLLLLDLVLPGMDGLEVLREVHEHQPTLPVIILTARGEEDDRVRGLQLGADDYIVKPFSVRELTARVAAVLRRSPERTPVESHVELPCGNADLSAGRVNYHDGRSSELSERETELLRYFAGHPGRVISREELMTRVWKIDPRGLSTRAIDMQIARLREKLRDNATAELIRTVRGRGYEFVSAEVTQ